MKMPALLRSFYLHRIVYYIGFGAAVLFALSFFLPSPEKIAGAETTLADLEQVIRNIP